MEVMEEGNLMDRVRILLQRDSGYYQQHQRVLQENLCIGVVGGVLDFPHYASFAAVKMVKWWEDEYLAAFNRPSGLQGELEVEGERGGGCGGVAKTSAPSTMVSQVAECGAQLLEHLHTLSQEALDHADLQVLTGTLGAAALIKNCLWIYNQHLTKLDDKNSLSLLTTYKNFQEMSESLAERLLDLHCRLISLYVMQDADSLNWEQIQPFFESERGSFVIQMWWLYMQGTRSDLWNTVPPKTAQRVLAGMLNESLTIFTVRYTQARASSGRAMLLITDISNLLLCVRHILPSICNSAPELTGVSALSQVVRDVHAKCHALLQCLLLRGSPLSLLYKVFNKGWKDVPCFSPLPTSSIAPWISLSSSEKLTLGSSVIGKIESISLELSVLLTQPQPSWHLLLKVLMMNDCWVANKILLRMARKSSSIGSSSKDELKCKGFLCSGDCYLPETTVEQALVHIVTTVGSPNDVSLTLLPFLELNPRWADCLDRKQVWNTRRPSWLQALVEPSQPCLQPVVDTVLEALQGGVHVSEVVALAVELVADMVDCLPPGLVCCCDLLTESLPADSTPLAHSVLVQVLITALYTQLIDSPVAERLCTLHDEQLSDILTAINDLGRVENPEFDLEASSHICEVQVSELLLTASGRRSLKVLYEYLKTESDWLIVTLGQTPLPVYSNTLLYTMFHVGGRPFDQVLAGTWSPDWNTLLHTPLGLSPASAWDQLSLRSEFWDSCSLSEHDKAVVSKLQGIFTGVRRLSSLETENA
ncbi:uncharacterized protein LOC128984248 [Macrosteles quadrilineatus]|uniref:uncharacterized protein LOC128984248 n=1 Tax=Macrosteles quadrilineatus TaxID=74068 RepID=UPI0023E10B70|nr:uncharacterized protein LOC128984248 [Macrosteles quadrilineatus]